MQFWIAKGPDQAANGPYSLAQIQKIIDNQKWRPAWLVSQDGAPYAPFAKAFEKLIEARERKEQQRQEEKRWRDEQQAEAAAKQVEEEAAHRRQQEQERAAQLAAAQQAAAQPATPVAPQPAFDPQAPAAAAPPTPPNPFVAPTQESPYQAPAATETTSRSRAKSRVNVTRQASIAYRSGVALSILGRIFLVIDIVIWAGSFLLYVGAFVWSMVSGLSSDASPETSLAVAGVGGFFFVFWLIGWLVSLMVALTLPLAMTAIGSYIASRSAERMA